LAQSGHTAEWFVRRFEKTSPDFWTFENVASRFVDFQVWGERLFPGMKNRFWFESKNASTRQKAFQMTQRLPAKMTLAQNANVGIGNASYKLSLPIEPS
jgi:hypothetical protein